MTSSRTVLSASWAQLENGRHSGLEGSQEPATPAASQVTSIEIEITGVTINLNEPWSLNTQI